MSSTKKTATKKATTTKPKVTSARDWKRSTDIEDVELPSGNVCRARRPGIDVFIKAGIVPDELTAIVRKSMQNTDAAIDKMMNEAVDDFQKMAELFDMVDEIVCRIVVEPEVTRVPAEGDERDSDTLYVDEIDTEDKMFLFSFAVGGTRDVASFREQQKQLMERVHDG
jgi:hypothetical protein